MAKVTIKTADSAADAAALPDNVVIDAKGRSIKVREIGPLEESRLVRSVGGDAAMNPVYMSGYVIPVCMIEEIDGVPALMPTTQREVDAAIQRADRHGIEAVLAHLQTKSEAMAPEAEAKN